MSDAGDSFPVEQTADGRWTVLLDNYPVTVQTRDEADLLASLPMQYTKLFTDVKGGPDAELCRRMIEVGKRYSYSSFAFRRLESWLSENDK